MAKKEPYEIVKKLHEETKEMGQTVSLSFSLGLANEDDDPENPDSWEITMSLHSGEFEEVPEHIQDGLFQMVSGLQQAYLEHPEELMLWAHEAFAEGSVVKGSEAIN